MLEKELQAKICDYLRLKGYFFSRTNNTPIFDPKIQRYRRFGKYVVRGWPDIVIIKKPEGKFVGIEVKKQYGTISFDQQNAGAAIKFAGGEYYVVRNWKDFEKTKL